MVQVSKNAGIPTNQINSNPLAVVLILYIKKELDTWLSIDPLEERLRKVWEGFLNHPSIRNLGPEDVVPIIQRAQEIFEAGKADPLKDKQRQVVNDFFQSLIGSLSETAELETNGVATVNSQRQILRALSAKDKEGDIE